MRRLNPSENPPKGTCTTVCGCGSPLILELGDIAYHRRKREFHATCCECGELMVMLNLPIDWCDKLVHTFLDIDLLIALEAFLCPQEKRKSTGGYAPVEDGDMNDLAQILRMLIERKWETDPDGDRPVDWELIDRTKYEPMPYRRQIPYRHHDEGLDPIGKEELASEVLEACITNAQSAMQRLNTEARILQSHRLDRQKQRATFQQGQAIRCVKGVDNLLTPGKIYAAYGYSTYHEGKEIVGVEENDQDGKYTSFPVEYFEATNE